MAWPNRPYKQYEGPPGQGDWREWQRMFNERIDPEEAARILSGEDQTPWQILGVKEGATEVELKKAYRKLVMEWHPDRVENTGKKREDCEEMLKKLNAAYSLLMDQKRYR